MTRDEIIVDKLALTENKKHKFTILVINIGTRVVVC